MEKYIVQAFVGEGSFGRVFKAKHKDDNSVVALKVIRKKGRSANDLKNLRQECDIQRQLKHPNIIQMIDSFDTEGELVVVTEFAEKELHSILGKEGCLSEDRTQNITWDLVSALYYLHSHRVLHRDLKPQNVLIDSDGHAKLCDFGLARNMTAATHVLTSIKGTPLYMAPELIDEKPYDHHADLWSLGCIVYELMAGQPPYCTTSIVKLVQMIRHKPVQWPTFISPNAFTFLQGLLHKDPNRRFTWPDLLNHPFVAGHVLILPEDQQSDSPFTRPLSESQMEAKQMQKDKINHIQRLTAQATKSDRRDREHRIVQHDCIPLSDDDSVRATSAFSVRDSLKTDDEDLSTVMSPSNAKLLAHEYKVMNNSNLVICNLENNLAQFATKNEKCEIKNIPEETKDELDKSSPEKVDKSNDKNVSSSKGSKKSKEITELASQSMKNPKSSINSGSDVSSGLSKSVPPSYKQKILQFSRDKLRFGSGGNKLTRSIKRSFTFNRSWDKNKSEGHRRISEPNVELQRISISKEERDKDIEKCELVDDSTSEKEINNDDSKSFNDAEAEPSSIEQEEWLAFLKSSILEVMEGDVDSLIQLNMVEMLMRWTCGGPSVCQSVSTLLSLPTVCPDVPRHISLQIQDVYLEAKVLHHFVHAIKRLTRDRNDICEEKVNAVSSMLELCACLCVRSFQAVQQLVLAIHSHKAIQTFYWLMTIYSKAPRIVLNTVGLLITILQDLPEHSELVEKILFGDVILDLPVMLTYQNDILKIRICILISLLCNFCCTAFSDAMSNKWDTVNCEYLESLQTHCNVTLNRAAKNAYKELSIMPFFVTQV